MVSASTQATPTSTPSAAASGPVILAVVTDFGNCDAGEGATAAMVKSWQPVKVISAGDSAQNGENGCTAYTKGVDPYYGDVVKAGKFLPTLGNHDYDNTDAGLARYRDYFASVLPQNGDSQGRYGVTMVSPGVYVWTLDANLTGLELALQRDWLANSMAGVKAKDPKSWRIVVLHQPPYTTSDSCTNSVSYEWPYKDWGADLVVSGHTHLYEDITVGGLHYLTAGRASDADHGRRHYVGPSFGTGRNGALQIDITPTTMTWRYYDTTTGKPYDNAAGSTVTKAA